MNSNTAMQLEKLLDHFKTVSYPVWGHQAVMIWCYDTGEYSAKWKAGLRNCKETGFTFEGDTALEALESLYHLCLKHNYITPLPTTPAQKSAEANHQNALKVLEKHLGDKFYKTGEMHNSISEAMQEYAEQFKLQSDDWVKVKDMPDFDGDYLCLVVRKNECGTYSQYQKVISCTMNRFITTDNETVYLWRKLPALPDRRVLFSDKNTKQ